MKAIIIAAVFFLAACSSDVVKESPRKISQAAPAAPPSMTYEQFRSHANEKAKAAGGWEWQQRQSETQEGNRALHKRFMVLDRDNNGRLSQSEFSGY